jgi:recombination protein RecA
MFSQNTLAQMSSSLYIKTLFRGYMSKKTKPTQNAERQKAVEAAIAQIEKNHGKGAIMALGSQPLMEIPVIPSGCIQLDIALGVGGFPRGRIIEIYGPESSGKTTLTLHAIAEAQKMGGVAAFIDAEHAFDATYARKLGVNIEELLVSQPDTGEQALDICETLVRSGAIDMIVIDSVAALVPAAEINGEMGDSHMGLQARLMSQALRKLTGLLNKSSTSLIFINQLRMKIGVMFGNPETTTGGNALKFYATQRIDIRRVAALKDGENVIGNRTRVKVVKNKVAAPFTQCDFDILYGQGISREGSILDLAVELEIIKKSGTWFSYGNERLGQGRENARIFLKENVAIAEEVEAKIRNNMKDINMFDAEDAVEAISDSDADADLNA